ncbi:MAG: NADPH-dependent F420 reductase [Dehalococcoidia bacterium]|nr:NADPH-dependent F420 reductase [Dehalococcoidia bacterium]
MAKIAFIGGTGPEGMGLAMRLAKSGNAVFIGSRTEERAAEAVAKVLEAVPEGEVYGGFNPEGAEKADFVFVTVPADAHHDILVDLADAIADKIVVDVVVPMVWDKEGPRAIEVEEGSAAEQAQALLPKAKVVSAFHHLDATELQKVQKPMQGDVIVCADHRPTKKKVMDLVEQIEYVRALDGGGLANSRYTEQLTVLLLHINKIYKARAGIRVTGV